MNIKNFLTSILFGFFIGLSSVFIFDSGPKELISFSSKEKDSRSPSSIAKKQSHFEISFLSKAELFLLNKSEKKSYLKKVSQIITLSTKKSKVVLIPNLFIQKAWAEFTCQIYGLHPAVKENEAACARHAKGILISEDSAEFFDQSQVRQRDDGQYYLKCQNGQEMCNPALLGFEKENADSKPKLRCMTQATNENCLALETSGDQMASSLDLLNKANSEFWDEFENGVNELCIEEGQFNASDEGCDQIRTQMKEATREYRNRLTLRYKNLSRAIEIQNLRGSFADLHACRQREVDQDGNLAGFNAYGVKFVISGDTCFRVPSDARVRRNNDGTYRYTRQNINGEEEVLLGLSEISARSDRFINFNCGACNAYVNISACVEEAGNSDPDFSSLTQLNGRMMPMPNQACQDEFENLRTLEVNEEALNNIADPQNRRNFWETNSIQ